MAINTYMVELTTQVPITFDTKDVSDLRSFYEVVFDKTNQVIGNMDMNKSDYQLKVVSETKED
jgi:hypothetical protein